MGKCCTKCGEFKTFDCFSRSQRHKDGHSYWCRTCFSHKKMSSYTKTKRREKYLMDNYGMTLAEHDLMLVRQSGLCDICEAPLRNEQVDHCHRTGAIRALLCDLCNRGLGQFRDSKELLIKAVNYLDRH